MFEHPFWNEERERKSERSRKRPRLIHLLSPCPGGCLVASCLTPEACWVPNDWPCSSSGCLSPFCSYRPPRQTHWQTVRRWAIHRQLIKWNVDTLRQLAQKAPEDVSHTLQLSPITVKMTHQRGVWILQEGSHSREASQRTTAVLIFVLGHFFETPIQFLA